MSDPMTAPPVDAQRLREELRAALEGVNLSPDGMMSYPTGGAHMSVSFLARYGEALLSVHEAQPEVADTCDTLVNRLEGWGKAYPVDVFGEVSDEEREWLHATRPGLMDRISASMGRHMAGCIAEDVAALRAAIGRLVPSEAQPHEQ